MSKHAERDADAMWEAIPGEDRPQIDVELFTRLINEKYGRTYIPREFRSILKSLKMRRKLPLGGCS
jgi:hypothetical protein